MNRLKALGRPTFFVYPLIVIIAVPALLVINTIWNLKAFNRDVNFLIRHQAVSTADTLKPSIAQNLSNQENLATLLRTTTQANPEIISATIMRTSGNKIDVLATSATAAEAERAAQMELNHLAIGINQPFAGLSYDPLIAKNVWNVVVPITIDDSDPYLFALKLKTEAVDELLSRTSKDSFIILSILIVVTLILLANHFFFYQKAIEAKKLAELDKLKDEFISMASHELRVPVTALIGYLELLRDKIPPPSVPEVESYLNTLDGMTRDLRDLINHLLDVSRIEQGRLKVTLADTQVNDIIVSAVKTVTPLAQQKGLNVKFTPTLLPAIRTDPDRVRQVLANLVSNSVKYTLKGEIVIAAVKKDKFIEITVKDTGIGIPAGDLPKLFGKFHRVEDKQTDKVRGTGLGLWITKEIVELLGGRIFAESIYGTGSSFTFTLPLCFDQL